MKDIKEVKVMTLQDAQEIWAEMERQEQANPDYRVGFVIGIQFGDIEVLEVTVREVHPNCDYVYPLWQPTKEEFFEWAEVKAS